MTEREFLKYGYYFRDENLKVSRVLPAKDMEEINWLSHCLKNEKSYIKSNTEIELIDDYMVMFFNLFTDIQVGCVFYSMEEKNLCFLDMSRNLTKEEQKKFDFVCANEEMIRSKYFIKLDDLIKRVSMLQKEKQIHSSSLKEAIEELDLKDMIKEVIVDQDLKIYFLGTSIYDIQYKGRSFSKSDYLKSLNHPLSKEARIYNRIKDKSFNILLLGEDLKNQLYEKEEVEPILKKKIQ